MNMSLAEYVVANLAQAAPMSLLGYIIPAFFRKRPIVATVLGAVAASMPALVLGIASKTHQPDLVIFSAVIGAISGLIWSAVGSGNRPVVPYPILPSELRNTSARTNSHTVKQNRIKTAAFAVGSVFCAVVVVAVAASYMGRNLGISLSNIRAAAIVDGYGEQIGTPVAAQFNDSIKPKNPYSDVLITKFGRIELLLSDDDGVGIPETVFVNGRALELGIMPESSTIERISDSSEGGVNIYISGSSGSGGFGDLINLYLSGDGKSVQYARMDTSGENPESIANGRNGEIVITFDAWHGRDKRVLTLKEGRIFQKFVAHTPVERDAELCNEAYKIVEDCAKIDGKCPTEIDGFPLVYRRQLSRIDESYFFNEEKYVQQCSESCRTRKLPDKAGFMLSACNVLKN